MGRRLQDSVRTLTILNGQTTSASIEIGGFLKSCTIYAPATLPETVTVQIEPTKTGTAFCTLLSGASDITVPAGKAVIIMETPFAQLRVVAGANVGADRVFQVSLVVEGT